MNPKKIIIKIGTNTLTCHSGKLDMDAIKSLVAQIAAIKDKGVDVVIVTSGAIGAGLKELNLDYKPKDAVMQQVCAAVGQNILMSKYHSLFRKHKIKIAQILLTYDVFTNRKTYTNLRNSLNKLLKLGVIPIINENDPISIDEIGPSFGDNDMLSALIAGKVKADLLVMLTNVDGLFTKDPNHKDAVLIKKVKNINRKIEAMGGKPGRLGLGGMLTKIKAAKMATRAGVTFVIALSWTSSSHPLSCGGTQLIGLP